MSFLKKLTKEFKDLIKDDDDKDKKPIQDQTRDWGHADAQQHEQHPPTQSAYGQPPSQQGNSQPPLPFGWIAQWDGSNQRWYYVEQATGRTQWEIPVSGFPSHYSQPATHATAANPEAYHNGHEGKKSGGKGGMIAAGAGGIAVGALAAHALSDSDDESHGVQQGVMHGGAPPTEPPLEYNPDLSSSQRSSLQEAREDLAEAQAEVANESSPSSSDVEDLREAEEEYASEVESAHEELED